MTAIKAIETCYKGRRFRSRLEARWAVFFDALELDWEYEFEGVHLANGEYYLPDFCYMPMGWSIEIKPTQNEARNAEEKFLHFALSKVLCVAIGAPGNCETWTYVSWPIWFDYRQSYHERFRPYKAIGNRMIGIEKLDKANSFRKWSVLLMDRDMRAFFNAESYQSEIAERNGTEEAYHKFLDWAANHKPFGGEPLRKAWKAYPQRLTKAVNASRSARFEFGENGSNYATHDD